MVGSEDFDGDFNFYREMKKIIKMGHSIKTDGRKGPPGLAVRTINYSVLSEPST